MVAAAAGPQGQPVAVGEPEREHAPVGQHPGQGGEQGRLVVDPGEQVVADGRVLAALAEQAGQVGGVALDAGDPLGHPAALVGRPLGAGGQHGRRGVDHRDPVAVPGQGDGQLAGAAAGVDHRGRRHRQGAQHLPEQQLESDPTFGPHYASSSPTGTTPATGPRRARAAAASSPSGKRANGSTSQRGTSTNARSLARGWGTVSSGDSTGGPS